MLTMQTIVASDDERVGQLARRPLGGVTLRQQYRKQVGSGRPRSLSVCEGPLE